MLLAAGDARAAIADASFPEKLDGPTVAAWLQAQTTVQTKDIIAAGGGRVVVMVSRKAGAEPGRAQITIRNEIITREAAEEAKALSETAVIDIDCPARKAKVGPTQVYSLHDLTGSFSMRPAWTEWGVIDAGTTMDRIAGAACMVPAPEAAAGAPPGLRGAAGLPGEMRPLGPPPLLAVPGPPSPAVKPPPSKGVPGLVPPPPRPAPPPPPKPAPSPRAAAAPPSADRFASWAQVGVSSSADQARAAIARLPMVGARPTLVEPTTVEGQTFYRALVGGFSGAAEAAAFCQAVPAGTACTVRQR